MPPVSHATSLRLRYASGYIGLGMLKEAAGELETIGGEDRLCPEVLSVRVDLHAAANDWELLIAAARDLVLRQPKAIKGWILWANALRQLDRVAEAKAVLLEAEPHHWEQCGRLHFDLARYHCLLGEFEYALQRLRKAFKMDAKWKEAALKEQDLRAVWDELTP